MTKTTCHKRHCIDSNIGIHRRMIRSNTFSKSHEIGLGLTNI